MATYARSGGVFINGFTANLLENQTVKYFESRFLRLDRNITMSIVSLLFVEHGVHSDAKKNITQPPSVISKVAYLPHSSNISCYLLLSKYADNRWFNFLPHLLSVLLYSEKLSDVKIAQLAAKGHVFVEHTKLIAIYVSRTFWVSWHAHRKCSDIHR